jgi:hypothetical protein
LLPGLVVELALPPPVLVEFDLVEVELLEVELVLDVDPPPPADGTRFGIREADEVFTRLTVWLSATVRSV